MKVNMTGRQMCEAIYAAGIIRKGGPDGPLATPNEIWNSSPTGELYQVFEWFEAAKLINPTYFEELEVDYLRGDDL